MGIKERSLTLLSIIIQLLCNKTDPIGFGFILMLGKFQLEKMRLILAVEADLKPKHSSTLLASPILAQAISPRSSASPRRTDTGERHGLRLPPYTPVLDLEPRLRCRECGARSKVVVSIRWG